jgi:hypothetical protein
MRNDSGKSEKSFSYPCAVAGYDLPERMRPQDHPESDNPAASGSTPHSADEDGREVEHDNMNPETVGDRAVAPA